MEIQTLFGISIIIMWIMISIVASREFNYKSLLIWIATFLIAISRLHILILQ